jgi:two-component system, NtrC family, response regulator AtoC
MTTALVVEDDSATLREIVRALESVGCTTFSASSVREADVILQTLPRPDYAFIDVGLPDGTGLDLLPQLSALAPESIYFVTGNEFAKAALRELHPRRFRHQSKPVTRAWLRGVIAEHRNRSIPDDSESEREGDPDYTEPPIEGDSLAMAEINRTVERLRPSHVPVLIHGESGVGKEVVARRIHDRSPRSRAEFVALNCGAVPPSLIDAELFGTEKGAFTGCDRSRPGVIERAGTGTLLLDEITEMPIELQTRFLRLLESGDFRRLGSGKERLLKCRIIATTNRVPEDAVRDGLLREDLFFRLAVVQLRVPALRERPSEAVLLARRQARILSRQYGIVRALDSSAIHLIENAEWPGNVRQLHNAVHSAFLMSETDVVSAEMFPAALRESGPSCVQSDALAVDIGSSIADVEQSLIQATLDHYAGDKRLAAEALGISIRTLYTRLRIYSERSRER